MSIKGLLDSTGSVLVQHRCGRQRGVLNGLNVIIRQRGVLLFLGVGRLESHIVIVEWYIVTRGEEWLDVLFALALDDPWPAFEALSISKRLGEWKGWSGGGMAMVSWQGVMLQPATTTVTKVVLVLLLALKSAARVRSRGCAAVGKSAARSAARVLSHGQAVVDKLTVRLAAQLLSRGCTGADKLAAKPAAQVRPQGRAAIGKLAVRSTAQELSRGCVAIDKWAVRSAARSISRGHVVRWAGLLFVGQERWAELGSAVGSAVSNGWGGHPMEQERLHEAMGVVVLGVGWCIIK